MSGMNERWTLPRDARRESAARMIQAACEAVGASPSTCLIVPGLFLQQLEINDKGRAEA